MSSSLLFVAADRREVEPFTTRWEAVAPIELPVLWGRTGIWRGRKVLAIANGMGVDRAAAAVRLAHRLPGGIGGACCIGTCGALDPSIQIAEVVIGETITDGSLISKALDPNGPPARRGVVRTSAHIAKSQKEKQKLFESGAIIVEMESAGVARVAAELDVPFYCVRAASDLANESFFFDYEKFVKADGGFNTPKIAVQALLHPFRGLPELIQLGRRSSAAAAALAEYLDNCKF